jgi:spore germination protein KA
MLFQWGLRKKQQEGTIQLAMGEDKSGQAQDVPKEPLDTALDVNIRIIQKTTGNSSDVVIRRFTLGQERTISAALIFTDGLADEKNVYEFLLEPLLAANIPVSLSPNDIFTFAE